MKLYGGFNLTDWFRVWKSTDIAVAEDWEAYCNYCRNSAIFRVYTAGQTIKEFITAV